MLQENIIKGMCKTNLDDYNCSQVKGFARVPNVGERVSVKYKGHDSDLKICQITHSWRDNEPFLIVELTRNF